VKDDAWKREGNAFEPPRIASTISSRQARNTDIDLAHARPVPSSLRSDVALQRTVPRLGLRIAASFVPHDDGQRRPCVQDGLGVDGRCVPCACLAEDAQVQTARRDGDDMSPLLAHVRRVWCHFHGHPRERSAASSRYKSNIPRRMASGIMSIVTHRCSSRSWSVMPVLEHRSVRQWGDFLRCWLAVVAGARRSITFGSSGFRRLFMLTSNVRSCSIVGPS